MNVRQGALTTFGALACATLLLGTTACATGKPTDTPGVEEMGEFVKKYTGAEVEAAIGYRYAANNPGDEWLMLDVALTSAHGQVVEIDRAKIFVRNPAGDRIPMASQSDFSHAFGDLRAKLKQADIQRDPLDYFPHNREDCEAGFFSVPGDNVVFEELTVDDDRVCQGRLFFKIPGGVTQGRWVLGIDLQETRVRIPFEI